MCWMFVHVKFCVILFNISQPELHYYFYSILYYITIMLRFELDENRNIILLFSLTCLYMFKAIHVCTHVRFPL